LATYPILDNQRRASRVIVMRREVTEQRRLEASLAQAEKLAAVGQLAAGVAHEINNPLTAIIANAQFLTEDLSPMSDSYQSAQLVARAGERAARVVRRLLDFARQEELDCQPLDVNDSLREAMTLMEPQLASSGIRLVTHLEPNLAPVNGSPDHILGIWLNLLINALDALDGRNGERVIEIHSQRLEEFVQVSIIDNGPGIPADQLPHIFHPFYTTKAPGKGTGLGLSTSYLTVEQHGGRIDVISEPGQGTALIVKLPICT
jgi:two-component system NtrC family sensor kinase